MEGSPSLVRRLLWALVGSLTAVALVLVAGGAWLINGVVEGTADRLLGASARAIAETLAVEDDQITLDLPPFALGMLENNARDNIYYSVRHNGQLVTGYPDLPSVAPAKVDLEESSFRYEQFRGARIRVAAEARRLPRVNGAIVVQVAETLDARREQARRMWLGLAILEGVLVGVVALLIWPAVRWSLQPVTQLREAMDARASADFTPLPVTPVPSELAGLVVGFNALLHRLELSVEGMRRFTADASHQMRTPLAILRTHIALLKKHGAGSPSGQASLADIELATDRLQGLLTGLISLARSEDAAAAPAVAATDLRAIARTVATDLAPAAAAAGVDLQLHTARKAVSARVDAVLLAELLANLVDNAIRYNRTGGTVKVSVRATLQGPSLIVEDDGPGIPETERQRVFERFYRLARDQQRTGSGLGLSIVAAIAQRLSAKVDMAPGPGGTGLTVTVRLAP